MSARLATALVLAIALFASCSDGTIELVEDDETPDTIRLEGNIRDLNPQVAGASIVVFVFTGLEDPGTFQIFDKQRSVAIAPDADPAEFTVTQIEQGAVTVVFLQEDPGDPDGQIDPGDPTAILSDPDEILENVRGGETIRVTDIDIDFRPGVQTAEAESIRSVRTDEQQ